MKREVLKQLVDKAVGEWMHKWQRRQFWSEQIEDLQTDGKKNEQREKNARVDSQDEQVDRLEPSMWPTLRLRTPLMRNQIRHVQPLHKYMCVPELTKKADELAARHA